MQYGEAFERMSIPGMGRQGSGWCAINPDGVLVLMAHQNYFHRNAAGWFYEVPAEEPTQKPSAPAARSLAIIASYFSPGKSVLLMVAEFHTDGGWQADGTWIPSKLKAATGWGYDGEMRAFDQATGYLLCDNCRKFKLP